MFSAYKFGDTQKLFKQKEWLHVIMLIFKLIFNLIFKLILLYLIMINNFNWMQEPRMTLGLFLTKTKSLD